MDKPPIDPPIFLSSAEWKKHKGIIATLVKKKTGITEALQKFEKMYFGWVGWHYLGREALAKILTAFEKSHVPLEMVDVVNYHRQGKAFIDAVAYELGSVKKLADTYSKQFKDNKIVPSATRVFLEKMSVNCTTFPGQLRSTMNERTKFIQKTLDKVAKTDRGAIQSLHI
jgi:hypothetical protein